MMSSRITQILLAGVLMHVLAAAPMMAAADMATVQPGQRPNLRSAELASSAPAGTYPTFSGRLREGPASSTFGEPPTAAASSQGGVIDRVGAWPYGPSYAVDVDTQRDLIFLGAGGAVLILDGTDRTNPALISGDIRTAGLVRDARYDPATQRLFLACGEGGLEIWDVQDPAAPVRLSRTEILYFDYETPVRGVQLWQQFAILECAWGYVQCVDVSDPEHPVQTGFNGQMGNPARDIYVSPEDGRIHSAGAQYYLRMTVTASGGLNGSGQKEFSPGGPAIVAGTAVDAYVGYREYLYILDLQAPGFPAWSIINVGGIDDLVIQDGVLYLTNRDGLQIWDVQVPNTPVLLGTLPMTLANRKLAVAEGYAYIADGQRGLRVIEIGDGSAPAQVGAYDGFSVSWRSAVVGDYACIAQSYDGLRVLDISDPAHPASAASLATAGEARDLAIAGDRLYMAAWTAGMRIIDVSDPTTPAELGSYQGIDAWRVAISGTTAFVIEAVPNEQHWLYALDVSNPASVELLGSYQFPASVFIAWDLVIDGDYVYVAGHDAGVLVLDVSDPDQITQVASFMAPSVTGLFLDGDLLYVGAFDALGGLFILDVSDPTHPQQIGSYSEAGFSPWHIYVDGSFAFVSDFSDLTVFEVGDPTTPQILGDYRMPGDLNDIVVREQHVLVADGSAGYQIVENLLYSSPGVDWQPQVSGTSEHLRNVFFIDAANGWCVGDGGTILATQDGGESWIPLSSGTSVDLFGLFFVDHGTGWTGGRDGVIITTTDGGMTWSPQSSGTTQPIGSIQFVDGAIGWAVGGGGCILKTTNGGANWQPQASGTSSYLVDASFVDALNGWIAGDEGLTLRTTNGGATWQSISVPGQTYLSSIDFVDLQNGWLTGSGATIYRTTNGGMSWLPQYDDSSTPYSSLTDIEFIDTTTGWVVGGVELAGQSLDTADGGATWETMLGGQQAYLTAVHFVDEASGWAVGQYGTILRSVSSTTGLPETPTPDASATPAALTVLNAPDPFRETTAIRYSLPASARVQLNVYDAAGRKVRTLFDDVQASGPHAVVWDGRSDRGTAVSSGVYWYRLEAGDIRLTGRMIRLR